MTPKLSTSLENCEASLRASGFDLLHRFSVNKSKVHLDEATALPTLGHPDPIGLLVANSKALWPIFVEAMRTRLKDLPPLPEAALLKEVQSHFRRPLDEYLHESIERARRDVHTESWVGLGYTTSPRPIPLQRYAVASGFAHLGQGHLCLQPEHGPWIALRAVIVFAESAEGLLEDNAEKDISDWAPCTGCAAPCLSSDEIHSVSSARLKELPEDRQEWIKARNACPLGRASRYGEEQLLFHYRPR